MYVIIWEYQIKPEKQSEFEKIYAPQGAWAELFKKGSGYLGTELLRAEEHPQHYITIDRWDSEAEYKKFLAHWQSEYKALDKQCEGLTERESLRGKWASLQELL